MVGRVIIRNLLTILLCFMCFYPGRDTQVNFTTGNINEIYASFMYLFGFWSVYYAIDYCVKTTIWFIRFFYAFVDTTISYSHSICPVIRKHGRWKCRNVLPSTWLVLTMITLSAQHIVSFTSQGSHHREIFLGSLSRTISHDDHRTQVARRKTPFREWVPFFNDSFALDHENSSQYFYRVDLLDIVFYHSPIESLKTKVIPSSLLSAQGTFMAE
eukprot:scaffold10873_cov140-Amphora_coffeaeformis.AAC.1